MITFKLVLNINETLIFCYPFPFGYFQFLFYISFCPFFSLHANMGQRSGPLSHYVKVLHVKCGRTELSKRKRAVTRMAFKFVAFIYSLAFELSFIWFIFFSPFLFHVESRNDC